MIFFAPLRVLRGERSLTETVKANGEAIGLIETKGIVAAVEACDAALKAANVTFVEQHKVGSGLVAITLKGDVAAVAVTGAPSTATTRPTAASSSARACIAR